MPKQVARSRTIQTVYYLKEPGKDDPQKVMSTLAKHPTNVLKNIMGHLQLQHYGANMAECFDTETGIVYGVAVVENWLKGDEPVKVEFILERVGLDDIAREADRIQREREKAK
jgi:hypothetical protein